MKTLTPLRLDQGAVTDALADAPISGEITQTWFGYDNGEYMTWYRKDDDRRHNYLFAPTHKCEVILPALMMGDSGEIYQDIRHALYRHVDRQEA